MDPKSPPVVFATPKELRAWFAKHAAKEPELWIKYYKVGSGKVSVRYQEALDEALCVGWIDGQIKGIDDDSYMQRWTPRKKGSYWSAVNIAKAEKLVAAGRMKKAGLAAFELRDKSAAARYSFENLPQDLPPALAATLRASKAAWAFWQEQPAGYRKTATWWVLSAKKEETREKRLKLVIHHAARGERLPHLTSPSRAAKKAAKRPARAAK